MDASFTNWIKNVLKKENPLSTMQVQEPQKIRQESCTDPKRCMELLRLVIDGQASHEEETTWATHVEECMPCYRKHNLEKAIKEVLVSKVEKKSVPFGLVESIRSKIKDTTS